jgi:hypothetical protein
MCARGSPRSQGSNFVVIFSPAGSQPTPSSPSGVVPFAIPQPTVGSWHKADLTDAPTICPLSEQSRATWKRRCKPPRRLGILSAGEQRWRPPIFERAPPIPAEGAGQRLLGILIEARHSRCLLSGRNR